MNGHVRQELEAYHDGQLHGAQQRRVAAHLETCTECCAALAQLERLSTLLQEAPAPETWLTPERFTAQVRLRLQPREAPARHRHHWVIPALLVGAWAFLEAVWVVSSGLLVALTLGLGEQLGVTWLQSTGGFNPWQLPQAVGQGWHGALPLFSFLASSLLSALMPLALLGGISILFWGWWVAWRPHESRN